MSGAIDQPVGSDAEGWNEDASQVVPLCPTSHAGRWTQLEPPLTFLEVDEQLPLAWPEPLLAAGGIPDGPVG